jgi:hypothetical protein
LPQSPAEAVKNAHVPQRLLPSLDFALNPRDVRRLLSPAGIESKSKHLAESAAAERPSTRRTGAAAAALNT